MINLFQTFLKLPKNKCSLLILCMVLITFVAVSYSCIPLIFYRPNFICNDKTTGGFKDCKEEEACLQQALISYSKYNFISIPQQYKLFCQSKIIQTKIMTLMMIGHFLGALLNIPLAKFQKRVKDVLVLFSISSAIIGIVLLTLIFLKGTTRIGIVLMVWTLVKQPIVCFISVIPGLAFPEHKQRAVGLIWSSWSILSIFLPQLFWLIKDWKFVLSMLIGVPHLVLAYIFYLKIDQFSLRQNSCLSEKLVRDPSRVEKRQANWLKLALSPYLINFVMFIIFYGGSYVNVTTSMLYLNTLFGNLYFNLSLTCVIQTMASIIGIFIGDNFNKGKVLIYLYSMLSIIFCLSPFCTPFVQSCIILISKVIGDCLWVLLSQFLYTVIPLQFVPLLLASKNCYSLLVSSMMPILKYEMEGMGYTLLPAAGLINVLSIICYFFIKPIQQDQQQEQMIQLC